MPELPEVEALRGFLERNCRGKVVAETHLLAFPSLKTFKVPLTALHGLETTGAVRRGKYLGLEVGGLHPSRRSSAAPPGSGEAGQARPAALWLVFHLARAGWLSWRDEMPGTLPRPGRGPVAFRLVFDDGSGFDLTEAGTQKGLALYVVEEPEEVPGIAGLGPDPLADDFTPDALEGILATVGRSQIKRVLRDQHIIAGIGNAYSDEILHAARMSPFKPANGLDATERAQLYEAIRGELTAAVERVSGLAAQELKDDKRAAMRVHGRTGQPCPVCGSTILEVSYADSSLQYCPTCQTGGKPLADRRLSRLLK